jgi:biotin operon repressor
VDVRDIILAAFQDAEKPLDAKGVAATTGLERADVSKQISKLKKEGVLTSPKVCFYELAETINIPE